MITVRVREIAELLRQIEAVIQVLGRDEVLSHLDTAVEILDLMGGAGRDEHRIAKTLDEPVALDAVLPVQALTKLDVKEETLVVDRVVMGFDRLTVLHGVLKEKQRKDTLAW